MERGGNDDRYPLPNLARSLWERHELTEGSRARPQLKTNSVHFSRERTLTVKGQSKTSMDHYSDTGEYDSVNQLKSSQLSVNTCNINWLKNKHLTCSKTGQAQHWKW